MGDEGHGFYNEVNRLKFFNKLDQFPGKYLGGNEPSTTLGPLKILEMPAKEKSN